MGTMRTGKEKRLPDRKRDNPLKHFVLALLLALAVYFLFYNGIEHLRNRKGPWVVTFSSDSAGTAQVVVNQQWLGISNVTLSFPGTSAKPGESSTFRYSQPRPVPYEVPFGRCLFMDTTFLPGTLTFQLFGHEIEFLPRVIILDHQEYPWHSGTNISVNSPSSPAR